MYLSIYLSIYVSWSCPSWQNLKIVQVQIVTAVAQSAVCIQASRLKVTMNETILHPYLGSSLSLSLGVWDQQVTEGTLHEASDGTEYSVYMIHGIQGTCLALSLSTRNQTLMYTEALYTASQHSPPC